MSGFGRRGFLGAGTVAATRAFAASDQIQVGVVGVGGRGSWLARAVRGIAAEFANCRLAAVCDVYEKRRRQRAEQFQCDGYLDYRELLQRSDIDAVVIATPDHWHARIAIEAMEKGKDVYVEKPMCHTIEEARQMVETVRRTRRVLQVGSHGGSSRLMLKAKEVVAEGRIGKLIMSQGSSHRNSRDGEWNWRIDPGASPDGKGDNYIDWKMWLGPAPEQPWTPDRYFRFRKYWDYSGGVATDLFYHSVAPFNMVWGGSQFPSLVTASGGIYAFPDREVPDTFHMLAEYPKGHSLVLTSSMANAYGTPLSIRGHDGTILFERGASTLVVRPEPGISGPVEDSFPLGDTPEDTHMRNFLECVRTRAKPNIDVEIGAAAQVAITMSVMAYRRRQVLTFDEKDWSVRAA